MKPLVYLAAPYSSSDPQIRLERFAAVNRVAAKLIKSGEVFVFSPISHTHPLAEAGELPQGWDYWKELDERFLSICDKLIILKLPGWENSVGIKGEKEIAELRGIPIEYLEEK